MADSFRVDISDDLKKLFKNLSTENANKLMKRTMQFYSWKLRDKVVTTIDKERITNTGRLKNSISIKEFKKGNEVGYKVSTNVNYASAVEFGSKPHKIGINTPAGFALQAWVKRKLKGDFAMFLGVRKKIMTKGTKGKHFMKASADWMQENLDKLGKELIKVLGIE